MPTMAPTAASLKDKGNICFKSGDFSGAIKYYSKAEAADPIDAVYPSNLSAAFYEQGEYFKCYSAICRSKRALKEENPALSLKLSTRLAKTLSCGVRNGAIALKALEVDIGLINELRIVSEASSSPEAIRAWNDWQHVARDFERVEKGCFQARSRLASLPLRKRTGETALEYYTVGQDDVMSLAQDWGPGEKEGKNPIDLARMSDARLSALTFFFGGVGDGRHVLGTIVGLHQARLKLNKRKRQLFKAHLTMVDIHPSALARDLCLLFLIDELANSRDNGVKEAELKMTLICLWMGIIMPSYCNIRLKKAIKVLLARLQTSPSELPSFIHVVDASIPRIVASLKYWDTELGKKTARTLMEKRMNTDGLGQLMTDPSMSSTWKKEMEDKTKAKNEQLKMQIDMMMDDDQVIQLARGMMSTTCPDVKRPRERKEWVSKAKAVLYEQLVKLESSSEVGTKGPAMLLEEELFNRAVGGFVPPANLRSRSDELEALWQGILNGGPSDVVSRKARNHVYDTWKPNATLFDRIHEKGTGYPDPKFSASNFVTMIHKFNQRMRLARGARQIDKDCPAYSILGIFFDGVIDALTGLKGHLQLEVLLGDLNEELLKMQNGDDVTRPKSFPRTFTRIWLSNVPDYTGGPLPMAIYNMRSLENAPDAALAANCLMNSGVWENGDHFVHNYTQLNCKDYARFFGCRILTMDPAWGLMQYAQEPLPRPLTELPSREELSTWLTRVLLNIICPSKTGSGTIKWVRVRFPNTLAVFIGLLLRLHEIGYPSHWISEYLASIVNDTLVTDLVPYLGDAPIPLSQMGRRGPIRRRLNLDPWRAEMETMVLLAYEAIPFPVVLPDDFGLSYHDIAVFEAPRPTYGPTTVMHMYGQDPVFTLIFYDYSKVDIFLFSPIKERLIPEILDGKHVKKGEVFIVTCIDVLGVLETKIRWRMSRNRVAQMKESGKWNVCVYRSDVNETSMFADGVEKWKEVNPHEVQVR